MDRRGMQRLPAALLLALAPLAAGARAGASGWCAEPSLRGVQRPTGEIAGRVADIIGTPLQGVAVIVSGPPLPGPRFAVTTGAGLYRVTGLPAGTYSVAFSLNGFATNERREINLSDGAHAEVHVELTESADSEPPPRLVRGGEPALVVRGAANRFSVTARADWTSWRLQSDNLTAGLRAQGAGFGNPIRRDGDADLRAGGPVRRDRLWLWGSAAYSAVDRGVIGFYTAECLAPDGSPVAGASRRAGCMHSDTTTRAAGDLKLQARWNAANRTTLLWGVAATRRPTRGASAFDRPEHTNRQSDFSYTRPVHVEHQWAASDRLLLDGSFTFSDGRFVLDFQDAALAAVQGAYDRYTLVSSRSGVRTAHSRPKTEAESSGRFFLSGTPGGDHAVSFGAAFLDRPRRQWDQTGGGAVAVFDSRSGRPLPYQAHIVRDGVVNLGGRRFSAFVGDSHRRARLSVDAGLRFERQDDKALEASIPANPVLPDLLPAVGFAGADSGVVYHDVSPRVAVTWTVTGSGRTVVKAAAARHWGADNTSSARLQPTGQTRLVYWWNDANADGFVQAGELDLARGPAATPSANYDPANPASVRSPATVDPALKNHITDEFTARLEHRLARQLTVRIVYTGRKTHRIQATFPVEADGSLVDSSTFSPVCWTPSNCPAGAWCPEATYYQRDEALPAATVLRNDGEYAWRHGVTLDLHKRMAGGWMLDVSLQWNTAAWHFPRPTFDYTDPTNIAQRNGTEHSVELPHWVVEVSAASRLPWGLATAAAFTARQGLPYARGVTSPNRGVLGSTVVDIGRYGPERYPPVCRLDWQVDRTFKAGRAKVVPVLNVYNLLNANTVLARNRVQNTSSANHVTRVLAPRIVHLGVEVKF